MSLQVNGLSVVQGAEGTTDEVKSENPMADVTRALMERTYVFPKGTDTTTFANAADHFKEGRYQR